MPRPTPEAIPEATPEATPDATPDAIRAAPARTRSWLVLVMLLLCCTSPAMAQMVTHGPGAKAKTPAVPPLTGLEPRPFVCDEFGLTVHLPLESVIAYERIRDTFTISIRDGEILDTTTRLTGAWSMRFVTLESKLPQPTPATQLEDHLALLRLNETEYTELVKEPFTTTSGLTGQICYVKQTSIDGRDYITGWLVLPRSRTATAPMFIATILTMAERLDHVRPLLERSFRSITLEDVTVLAESQRHALLAADRFLASLDESTLRRVIDSAPDEQWLRIYRRDENGLEQEIGYSRMQLMAAPKKEVDVSGGVEPRTRLPRVPGETGLLVQINSRVIEDQKKNLYIDMRAAYWMSWDQQEEAWSIIATRRVGEESISMSETGARLPTTGEPPVLSVVTARSDTRERTPHEWRIPPRGYMSQALTWILGRTLAMPGVDLPENSAEGMTFYAYNATGDDGRPRLSKRHEQWKQQLDVIGTQGAAAAQWMLTTHISGDPQPYISLYENSGGLIRRTRPTGEVTEPINPRRLHDIWSGKGLKTSAAD